MFRGAGAPYECGGGVTLPLSTSNVNPSSTNFDLRVANCRWSAFSRVRTVLVGG